MSKQKPVPPYHRPYEPYFIHTRPHHTSFERLNRQQAGFFRRWKNALKRGEGIAIEGQNGYIRKYVCESVWEMPSERAVAEIELIFDLYGDPTDDALAQEIANVYVAHGFYESALELFEAGDRENYYLTRRIADCYILLGRYKEAHEILAHHIKLGSRSQGLIDSIWSLKLISGARINGCEMLTLLGPQITDFGRENIERVRERLDTLLETYERELNIQLIEIWADYSHSYLQKIETGNLDTEDSIGGYSFGRCETAIAFVKKITRLAENIVREQAGIPRVGEGWPSETRLFQEIRQALPLHDVQQHYSPYWLDRQHLDIFIPDINIALEYQGLQHDEPVEYFGGQEAYERNQERDARKKQLCDMYGVQIIYVRPGYSKSDVFNEIRDLAGFDIDFQSGASVWYSVNDISDYVGELLQIDAKTKVTVEKPDYKVDPEFQVEQRQFDLGHKVSRYKLNRYRTLSNEIQATYGQRLEDPDAIDKVINLCKKQIALSFDIAQYEYQDRVSRRDRCLKEAEEYADDEKRRQYNLAAAERIMGYPHYQVGYEYIVKIFEKQHMHQEALDYALRAKSECWNETPHWDKKIFQLSHRIVRRRTNSNRPS